MKVLLLSFLTFFAVSNLWAQKIELSVTANSGLFHYSGNDATSTTLFLPGQTEGQYRANNPHGKNAGFSYGAGMQAQLVVKNFIAGVQTGYEVLRSREDVNGVFPYSPYTSDFYIANSAPAPATGHSVLQSEYLNINPYIGYRLHAEKINIDLMPGIDIGYNLDAREKGAATSGDGTVYREDYKLSKSPADVRLQLGIAASFKKFGFMASYAHGLTNYESDLDYLGAAAGPHTVHSEVIRLGLTYRLF